jgi:hypothetical protein
LKVALVTEPIPLLEEFTPALGNPEQSPERNDGLRTTN